MYCKHCGNEINENSKFCKNCGAEIKANAKDVNNSRTNFDTVKEKHIDKKSAGNFYIIDFF